MELRTQKIRDILAPYIRRVEGDDSPCVSLSMIHHKCRTACRAKQSLKELHAFGKRHALARPFRSPILEKETADQAGIRLFIMDDPIPAPPNGLSITHHHPMRNAVRAEIAEMSSSSRHQRDSYPILSVQACAELYPN